MNKPRILLRPILSSLAVLAVFVVAGIPARAQVAGPIAPPPKFEVKRIPAKPDPGAPPLPSDEIIRRFTQNEDLIKKSYDAGNIVQTVKVEELAEHGGEFTFTGEQYTKPDGERYERVVKPPQSTLHYTEFSLEDVKTLGGFPLFFLTTDQSPLYNLSYEGHEKLDQIDTLIFRVQPKKLEHKALFDGVIWIDNQDFAIVKSYGQFVTDAGNAANGFPFSMFETYRENLTGHFWFPTYIRSDGEVKTPQGSVPIRLVVRSENFKPDTSNAAPAPTLKPAKPNQD